MDQQIVTNMKYVILILLMVFTSLAFSQEGQRDYFSFHKNGVKYLKPIKYVVFNPEKDKKVSKNKYTYFYIGGQRFKFQVNRAEKDTLDMEYLEKVKISEASKLSNEEYLYYDSLVSKDGFWKEKIKKKPPMPITKVHQYFKVYILEDYKDKIIRRLVDWEKSHSYK